MSELPKGWEACDLKECVDVLDSSRIPVNSSDRAKRKGNIPYYGATGQVGWIDDFLFDEEILLIGEDGAPFFDKSKPIAYIVAGKSWVNNHAHVLRAKQGITSNQLLKYFLDWFDFNGFVNGTTRLKLTQGAMNKIPVPLPPLAEQCRIVAKLEALLGKIDDCRKRLDKIPFILKRFRQSVLAAACSGRLTADWRDDQEIFTWTWERAENVCTKVQSGGTPKAGFSDSCVPFLKVYNIANQKINFEYRPQYVGPAVHRSELKKSIVLPGDVVMNIVGPPLGKVAIIPDAFPEWNINQAMTLFRPSSRITTGWLYSVLCSGTNVAKVDQETRGSAGQQNISLSQCRDFEFPVPPIPEQHEIVRRVEALFAVTDQIEKRYAQAKAHVDRMTQSILAKAFRGELVPQDPNDEPASALLDRIHTPRSLAATAPAPRKLRGGVPTSTTRVPSGPSARRGRPSKAALPSPDLSASMGEHEDILLSKPARKILKRMKPGRDYARADLIAGLDLPVADWNAGIKELKGAGLVAPYGARRGTKYRKQGM